MKHARDILAVGLPPDRWDLDLGSMSVVVAPRPLFNVRKHRSPILGTPRLISFRRSSERIHKKIVSVLDSRRPSTTQPDVASDWNVPWLANFDSTKTIAIEAVPTRSSLPRAPCRVFSVSKKEDSKESRCIEMVEDLLAEHSSCSYTSSKLSYSRQKRLQPRVGLEQPWEDRELSQTRPSVMPLFPKHFAQHRTPAGIQELSWMGFDVEESDWDDSSIVSWRIPSSFSNISPGVSASTVSSGFGSASKSSPAAKASNFVIDKGMQRTIEQVTKTGIGRFPRLSRCLGTNYL
jgi:hypothetical protein